MKQLKISLCVENPNNYNVVLLFGTKKLMDNFQNSDVDLNMKLMVRSMRFITNLSSLLIDDLRS